jgi:CNT family concentrative nucleoside transporter
VSFFHSLLGYCALLAIAWAVGNRSRSVPWRTLGVATLLQLALAGILLQSGIRQPIFATVARLVTVLRETALKANESLLFGGVTNPQFTQTYGPVIALEIAGILIFVASLSRILYHYRILPWVISILSRFMRQTLGISSAESVAVAGNVILGMTEAPLLVRPFVERLTESELFCLMVAGMATIAGTVMVIYSTILTSAHPEIAGHLFTASLISAPAAVAVAKLMRPEREYPVTAETTVDLPREDTRNGLEAAARGASEGLQLVLNIVAMLIAFIGLVALANQVVGWLDHLVNGVGLGWSLQAAAGYLFRPAVWLMGVPWHETFAVGQLMGLKTVLNEFVAYLELAAVMQGAQPLGERTFVITSYALCGFANFGSVAIMIGGIGGIAPARRADLARLGLPSLVGGTVATMLTGCVIGFFI